MENQEEVYEKHRYQINILECAEEVMKNLRNAKHPDLLKITIEEYESRLNDAIESYKDSINFDTIKSETNKRQACVISVDHPSFNFWLALHLSREDSFEIPLLLDAYFNEEFGYLVNFVGQVEFLVLKIIKHNVFYNCNDQKQAVVNWLREKKKEINTLHDDKKQVFNLTIGEINLTINESNLNQYLKIENKIEQTSIQNFFNTVINYQPVESEKEDNISNSNDDEEHSPEKINDEIDNELIPISLSYDETLAYFMKLTKVKNKKPITEDQVIYLVKSNFKFKNIQAISPKKHLGITIQKQYIRGFVYDFYKDVDLDKYKHKAKMYCQFLKANFSNFKNDQLRTITSNFAASINGKGPFK